MKDNKVGYYEATRPFGSELAAKETWHALEDWTSISYPIAKYSGPLSFSSFAVVYPGAYATFQDNEADLVLWKFLLGLHKIDRKKYPWDSHYSNFVYDTKFEMSLTGYGHFVVLMGPHATTLSRWFPVPAIVFNPSFVFEKLRAGGMFDKWRDIIRNRERAAQKGWINSKLGDFGDTLAAPQYALTLNPTFDIGNCPFTNKIRPGTDKTYDMSDYPFSPGEVTTLFWGSTKADI